MAVALHPDCSTVQAKILGVDVTYKVGAPGKHLVMNSLAVLAAAMLAGADLALAALALTEWKAPAGRGARSLYGARPRWPRPCVRACTGSEATRLRRTRWSVSYLEQ